MLNAPRVSTTAPATAASGVARVDQVAASLTPGSGQSRRTTIEPLVPPKPKEFDSATLIFMSRAVLAQ